MSTTKPIPNPTSTRPTPNYGTIPTSTASTTTSIFSHPITRTQTLISHRRPWREFLSATSFTLPTSYSSATSRIRRNLNYFRFNYSLITLIILFLSLLFHPLSLIVFLLIFLLWLFLFLSRDDPIVLFRRQVDDRVVLVVLFLVTVVGLVVTGVGVNVLVALCVAVVVVVLHAAFRCVDDLFLDEEEEDGGLVDVVEGQPLRPPYARVV